jgi:hypothetical protein
VLADDLLAASLRLLFVVFALVILRHNLLQILEYLRTAIGSARSWLVVLGCSLFTLLFRNFLHMALRFFYNEPFG